jgi:hypothetical protein
MLSATETQNPSASLFKENLILRPFIPIDVDMEFRGFVMNHLNLIHHDLMDVM